MANFLYNLFLKKQLKYNSFLKFVNDFPNEILELILIKCNYNIVSRVCKKWYIIVNSRKNKLKINEIFFDLTKDDPTKVEKTTENIYIFNSQLYNNGYYNKKIEHFINAIKKKHIILYNYFDDQFYRLFERLLNINSITFIIDLLFYDKIKSDYRTQYKLFKTVIENNFDNSIVGSLYDILLYDINWNVNDMIQKHKLKILNIYIKDFEDRIDDTKYIKYEYYGLNYIYTYSYIYEYVEKFSLKLPNDAYVIYNKNEKVLIIRYGNYKKSNKFELICNNCYNIMYFCNCKCKKKEYFELNLYQYPYDFFKFYKLPFLKTHQIKLYIITDEYQEIIFKFFSELSKDIDIIIVYYCFDSSKIKTIIEKFEFIPLNESFKSNLAFKNIFKILI